MEEKEITGRWQRLGQVLYPESVGNRGKED